MILSLLALLKTFNLDFFLILIMVWKADENQSVYEGHNLPDCSAKICTLTYLPSQGILNINISTFKTPKCPIVTWSDIVTGLT